MLYLKKCNYFTGDIDALTSISSIIKVLEFDGVNYLSLSRNESILKHSLSNCIFFRNLDDFKQILTDKSNLFRVNLLIFDFMHLSVSNILEYKEEIDKTNINHIILAKEYYYKLNSDINDFHFRKEYKNESISNVGWVHNSNTLSNFYSNSQVYISDNINKWSSSLESLRSAYIRDKKIDGLLGDIDI